MRTASLATLALLTASGLVAAPYAATGAPPTSVSMSAGSSPSSPTSASTAKRITRIKVRIQVRRLDHAWDVQPVGKRHLLVTQRDRARVTLTNGTRRIPVQFPRGQVWRSGETGLMGLAVDPAYARNHRFYTCQGGFTAGGGHDVRVVTWRLDRGREGWQATRQRTLLAGFPTTSGRHGGCRLLIPTDGSLLVGTGDAADGSNPQNLDSLGGKTLKLDRMTGAPWPTNAFVGAQNPNRRYIDTYGHRNVQGLAQRADGTLWSVEQGTDRNDEVNLLLRGANYGWAPGPSYDESRPMTDQSLPGPQQDARWSSGYPTLATSGATFVRGPKWGSLEGTLAVATLKAEKLLFLGFDGQGRLTQVRVPAALRRTYGRLRTVTRAPNNDLLVTTDNGSGKDKVLRVSPR